MYTKAEKLVEIGVVVTEIFGEICRFRRLVQNGAVVTLVISGVTGSILIIFTHFVATILPLNIFES